MTFAPEAHKTAGVLANDLDGMAAYMEAIANPRRDDPNWPLPSFDARDWAEAFCKIAADNGHPGIDEGWMIGWFANALMRGFDEAGLRSTPSVPAVAELSGGLARPIASGASAGWMPKVKALDWEEIEPGWWSIYQEDLRLGFEVRTTSRGTIRMRRNSEDFRDFDGDVDAAKAACQADFERRILAAFDLPACVDGLDAGEKDGLPHEATIVGSYTINKLLNGEQAQHGDMLLIPASDIADGSRGSPEYYAEKAARDWAIGKWHEEVAHRPLQNVHRRALDTTWRQVIRRFGGDDQKLCGPRHDELVARAFPSAKEEGR